MKIKASGGGGVEISLSAREATAVADFVEYAARAGLDWTFDGDLGKRWLKRGDDLDGSGRSKSAPVAHQMATAILDIVYPDGGW
jgi:hypothetical protein